MTMADILCKYGHNVYETGDGKALICKNCGFAFVRWGDDIVVYNSAIPLPSPYWRYYQSLKGSLSVLTPPSCTEMSIKDVIE